MGVGNHLIRLPSTKRHMLSMHGPGAASPLDQSAFSMVNLVRNVPTPALDRRLLLSSDFIFTHSTTWTYYLSIYIYKVPTIVWARERTPTTMPYLDGHRRCYEHTSIRRCRGLTILSRKTVLIMHTM